MSTPFKCRQIDKYDGQCIFSGGKIVYELGNYLGGGASGSVYQGYDPAWQNNDKAVAIKILNPLGYKNLIFGNINQCVVAQKGLPLNSEQSHGKAPMNSQNVWWLIHPQSKILFAAFEDPHRMSLRELPLTRCVEIWGMNPLGIETLSEGEAEKINYSGNTIIVDGKEYRIPIVSPKYLKFIKSRQVVCREMSNMVQIGEHPNIIDLLEVLELIQDSKTTLFLVLELINGGELFDRMKAGVHTNTEEFARKYFIQLLSGIEYCHKRGIVHRDLKPENLLLSDPSDTAILKIADFGLSAVIFASEAAQPETESASNTPNKSIKEQVNNNKSGSSKSPQHNTLFSTPSRNPMTQIDNSPASLRRLKSVVGSPHYIAPEIANGDPAGYDGRKVDMWSAGVILYSLFTGSLPFGSDLGACPRFKRYKHWVATEYAVAIKDGKDVVVPSWFWPNNISPLVGSLLVGLLHYDPLQRLTASDAARHPWCLGLTYEEAKSLPPPLPAPSFPARSTVSSSGSFRIQQSLNTPSVLQLSPNSSPLPSPPELSSQSSEAGTSDNCARRLQYHQALVQEQQRLKESEAMEGFTKQISRLELSSGNNQFLDDPSQASRVRRNERDSASQNNP